MSKRTPAGDKGTADRIEADDGGYWVRLVTKQALVREGECLVNCLRHGSYAETAGEEDVLSESLWSLRKACGTSYALAEIDGSGTSWRIDQLKGPHNSDPARWSVRQIRHLRAAFASAGGELVVREHMAIVGDDGMTYRPDDAPAEILRAIEERKERERQEERRRQEEAARQRHEREMRERAERGWHGFPNGIRALFAGPACEWDGEGTAPCTIFEALRILPNPLAAYRMVQPAPSEAPECRLEFRLRGGQVFSVSQGELVQAGGMPGALNLVNGRALENQDAEPSAPWGEEAPPAGREEVRYEIQYGQVMFRPVGAPAGTPFIALEEVDTLAPQNGGSRCDAILRRHTTTMQTVGARLRLETDHGVAEVVTRGVLRENGDGTWHLRCRFMFGEPRDYPRLRVTGVRIQNGDVSIDADVVRDAPQEPLASDEGALTVGVDTQPTTRTVTSVELASRHIWAHMSDGEIFPLKSVFGLPEGTTVTGFDDLHETLVVRLSNGEFHEVPHPAPRPVTRLTLGVDTQPPAMDGSSWADVNLPLRSEAGQGGFVSFIRSHLDDIVRSIGVPYEETVGEWRRSAERARIATELDAPVRMTPLRYTGDRL